MGRRNNNNKMSNNNNHVRFKDADAEVVIEDAAENSNLDHSMCNPSCHRSLYLTVKLLQIGSKEATPSRIATATTSIITASH
ncbi:hypothetical protein RIF29_32935 [Crotalaria pallida]|uniref:Uncharacterized protein n=1 Tax=Crotalaria pallida TaxID=3830 RepID=A0AAN9E7J5_CROPI